jgi:hypothetical protein
MKRPAATFRGPTTARAAALALALLATAGPAHAYVDPGSGSFLFQMLVAGMLSLAFTVRHYWSQVRAFVRRLFSNDAPDDRDPTS